MTNQNLTNNGITSSIAEPPNSLVILLDLKSPENIQEALSGHDVILLVGSSINACEKLNVTSVSGREVFIVGANGGDALINKLLQKLDKLNPQSVMLSKFAAIEWNSLISDQSLSIPIEIIARAQDVELPSEKLELKTTKLSDIKATAIDWLWPNYISKGTLTVIDGNPGEGKSTVCAKIAADISAGRPLPGVERPYCAKILMVTNEDCISSTLKPRLDKMHADASRIEVYDGSWSINAKGLLRFYRTLHRINPDLVIIDPLFNSFDAGCDTNSISSVNQAIIPLRLIAKKFNVAIVGVRHLRKGGKDDAAITRGMGSIGVVAGVRSALMLVQNPKNKEERFLLHTKSNQAALGKTVKLRIDNQGCHWEELCDVTYEDWQKMSLPEKGNTSALNDAQSFLSEILRDGPMLTQEILTQAKEAGISEDTLRRAKDKLGVSRRKNAGACGKWEWFLPPEISLDRVFEPKIDNPGASHNANVPDLPNVAQLDNVTEVNVQDVDSGNSPSDSLVEGNDQQNNKDPFILDGIEGEQVLEDRQGPKPGEGMEHGHSFGGAGVPDLTLESTSSPKEASNG
jgi:DNA repair protein RadA/Sms